MARGKFGGMGGMGGGNMQQLMRQAQKMQEQLARPRKNWTTRSTRPRAAAAW